MKTWNPFAYLSDADTQKAKKLYAQYKHTGELNRRLVEEVVNPNLASIEAAVGQKMDARYIGYAIEYILGEI